MRWTWAIARLIVLGRHLVRIQHALVLAQTETNHHLGSIVSALDALIALKQAELGLDREESPQKPPQAPDAEVGGVSYRDSTILGKASEVEAELTRVLGRAPDDDEVWAQLEHRL